MTVHITLDAASKADAIALVQRHNPGCVVDAWESNEGYDVLVWATEADSVNDDGAQAIARYTVSRG